MTWTKLDDSFWSEPKVLAAGNEAAGAFARMLSYCGRHETDGKVVDDIARFIAKPSVLNKLCVVSMLEKHDGHYLIPDYLEFNPSREQLEAKRERDKARKAS